MSTLSKGNWGDLVPRVLSAIVMIVVGVVFIYLGGVWFLTLACLISGIMMWELLTMSEPPSNRRPLALGGVAVVAQGLAICAGPEPYSFIFLASFVALIAATSQGERKIIGAYGLAIMLAPWGLVYFREDAGTAMLAWIVGVVVVTDIMGYFAGRLLGGPKFWPAISPKKTWSGTVAGWIGAALVGAVYVSQTGSATVFIFFSVALSFAGQLGDIAESAIKRRNDVKDSSSLIPGHGGFLDRFDALIAAAVVLLVLLWAQSLVAGVFG